MLSTPADHIIVDHAIAINPVAHTAKHGGPSHTAKHNYSRLLQQLQGGACEMVPPEMKLKIPLPATVS